MTKAREAQAISLMGERNLPERMMLGWTCFHRGHILQKAPSLTNPAICVKTASRFNHLLNVVFLLHGHRPYRCYPEYTAQTHRPAWVWQTNIPVTSHTPSVAEYRVGFPF